ncbi:DER1-domain-containing protein [Coniophora puteana RWD-64-598 SS2]|uniref:Derlin n=1 Tax=Coniophora puteana (strain RWD-64-598) TaxID=741705 RepID=A0A5M3MD33_CONPW|nr:DER1-domain-containing protein [Coniophora puteana RWD-64-598 SS2]EIW76993.1 DER1-domain-containing protein [Coniophora puteana RWD-64-598 SS2]
MPRTIAEEIRRIPPVTRFLCASYCVTSLAVLLGVVSPWRIVFSRKAAQALEVWRPFTTFFYGPGGLPLIFELFMLYHHSLSLETNQYDRRSSDYSWQLLFVCASILIINLPLNPHIHEHALVHALVYLDCTFAPSSAQTSLFGLVTFRTNYYPYVLLALDILVGGRAYAALGASGMVVGHLWWWLVWGCSGAGGVERGVLAGAAAHAPGRVREWFGDKARPRVSKVGRGVTVFAPGGEGDSYRWGRGKRLGEQ